MDTKKRVVIAAILFAAAFILDGVASKVLPFDELWKKALPNPKA